MNKRGDVNGWFCSVCKELTLVVHVDDGVTPMFLACRATGSLDDCPGRAVSLMYPSSPMPQAIIDGIGWEWFKPDGDAWMHLDRAMKEHIAKGGLELRPLSDEGREALAEVL